MVLFPYAPAIALLGLHVQKMIPEMILLYLMSVLAICTLILIIPVSLEINTREQKFVLSLACLFKIQYACYQNQRGLLFSVFGYSRFRKFSWTGRGKRKDEKRKKTKKAPEDKFMSFLWRNRAISYKVLLSLKVLCRDLYRLSSRRLEINLGTPDGMTNGLLSVIFTGQQTRRVRIRVNYLEENWLIFSFTSHLWAILWVFSKFTISPAVFKLGSLLICRKIGLGRI